MSQISEDFPQTMPVVCVPDDDSQEASSHEVVSYVQTQAMLSLTVTTCRLEELAQAFDRVGNTALGKELRQRVSEVHTANGQLSNCRRWYDWVHDEAKKEGVL